MNLISALLELLFDNVFFLVILFGIISFVMNKIRGTQQTAQKPPRNAMPPFGGDIPSSSRGSQGRMYETAPQTAMDRYPEPEQVQHSGTAEVPPLKPERPIRTRQSAPVAKARAGEREKFLHARHAAQGMMWSEVFGPPRALKQHRTRRK